MKLYNYPKKSLGQNFLIDNNIIKKIIKIGALDNNNTVLEIGPGTGNLTKEIIYAQPKKIIVVEKDKNLATYIKLKYQNASNLHISTLIYLNISTTKF